MRKPLRIFGFILSFLAGLYLLPAGAGLPSPDPAAFDYSILRKGKEIGRHQVRFVETPEGVRVDIKAKIKIKVAFITVFRLTHNASEFWRDGQLIKLDATTHRNSKKADVEVTAQLRHLEIRTANGIDTAPLDSIPTSFTKTNLWQNGQDQELVLIDTLSGLQRPSDFRVGNWVKLDLGGHTIDARYYSITRKDTGALTHEFWVDEAGNMMQTHLMTKDGQSIFYRFSGAQAS